MSHTFKTVEGTKIIANSDLSGDLSIYFQDGREVTLTINDIFDLYYFIHERKLIETLQKEIDELIEIGDIKTLSKALDALKNYKNSPLQD